MKRFFFNLDNHFAFCRIIFLRIILRLLVKLILVHVFVINFKVLVYRFMLFSETTEIQDSGINLANLSC